MALNSTHPLYDSHVTDWKLMRDTYGGEGVVKKETTTYLPATPAQVLDGMGTGKVGQASYDAYLARAVFHDYVSDAVESYIGLLHQKPAVFELPAQMESLLENATINGEGLQNLLRRINEQQLVTGRIGLLMDLPLRPDPANPLPYISTYLAEAVRNWDDSSDLEGRNFLNLVVLDESSNQRMEDMNWKLVEKYRVMELVPEVDFVPNPEATEEENRAAYDALPKVYRAGVFEIKNGNTVDSNRMRVPLLRGQALEEIPFVMINTKDVIPTPDNPPLVGLARLAIAIYRLEAGYRESLFMQSQDTLVTIGGLLKASTDDETVRVGAGARIGVDIGGDAKYIGVNSSGLAEQRQALENDKKRAETKSGQLVAPSGQVESDKTLQTRMAAQTATLNQIAWSGAQGLERILKMCARWMGLNPEEVKVLPNLDFSDFILEGKSLSDLMDARAKGAPLSLRSLHQVVVERGLSQMAYDDEIKLITEEKAAQAAENAKLGLDPTGKPIPPPPAAPTAPAKAPASA